MGFDKVEGWNDMFVFPSGFEQNLLFLKHVRGGVQPAENRALAALLIDAEQASLLLQVIEQYNQLYKFTTRLAMCSSTASPKKIILSLSSLE